MAHGIPTSYNDLMNWYGEQLMIELRKTEFYNDNFFSVSLRVQYTAFDRVRDCPPNFQKLLESGFAKSRNSFFHELLNSYRQGNWVDIERCYFAKLK